MEIKYTTDGKKVVVIGSLNSQEKIVQEVFIVNGSELPSGEHFVVRSLHDSVAVSWKETKIKQVEKEYEDKKQYWEREIKLLDEKYRKSIATLRGLVNYNKLVEKSLTNESLKNVVSFLEGKIKYVIRIDYNQPTLMKFEDFNLIYDREEMKLLSLFGRDDGSMTFKVHQYPDGSGGYNWTEILPFSDYDSAYTKFKELIASSSINDVILKLAKEHKIELNKEKVEKFKESKIKSLKENITNFENQIKKYREQIEKANND